MPEETQESDLSKVLGKHYESVKDWSPETLEQVLSSDPDPEAQAWVKHLATLPQDQRRAVLFAGGQGARANARKAFEETGAADALREQRNNNPLTMLLNIGARGGLAAKAVGKLTPGLRLGNLLKGAAIGSSALDKGPIDLATGDTKLRPPPPVLSDPSSVGDLVGALFNIGRGAPGLKKLLTGTPGKEFGTSFAEGALQGVLGDYVAGGQDPGTMAAVGGTLNAVIPGLATARVIQNLPKTGAEQLKPQNLDKFIPGMSKGEVPWSGMEKPLKIIRADVKDRLSKQKTLQQTIDEADRGMRAFFQKDDWLSEARKSSLPAVKNTVRLYKEAIAQRLALEPEKFARSLASMKPEKADEIVSLAVDKMFSKSVAKKQLISKEGTSDLLRLYEAKSLPAEWKESIRQNIRNFFLAAEPGSKASVNIGTRFNEVPSEARETVNTIFKDKDAFHKLVALRDAHDKFNDVAGPWTAITIGSRKNRAANNQKNTTSILTTIGNAAKTLSTENIAEAIMQKEGVLGKALAKWGEAVVSGKVTPNQLPRELVREIVNFVNTAGTPIRQEDTYIRDDEVKIGGKKVPVERGAEPGTNAIWRALTGAATKTPGPKAEQRYAAGAPR